MIDLSLEPNATFEQDLPTAYNGFFYVLDGSVQVGGDAIASSQVGWLAPATSRELVISAQDGARLVLYAGQPLGEPVTQRGPFVAGTPSEIIDFNRRFGEGEFTHMSELAKRLSGSTAQWVDATFGRKARLHPATPGRATALPSWPTSA